MRLAGTQTRGGKYKSLIVGKIDERFQLCPDGGAGHGEAGGRLHRTGASSVITRGTDEAFPGCSEVGNKPKLGKLAVIGPELADLVWWLQRLQSDF